MRTMKELKEEEESLTTEEIIHRYSRELTAPEMARKFGGYRHKYTNMAKKLGIRLITSRTRPKPKPQPKEDYVRTRGVKPTVTKPKMDNKNNPNRLKMKVIDRSNMVLVPVGLNREYVDVPFDATPEEKQAIIDAKIERIKARTNNIAA